MIRLLSRRSLLLSGLALTACAQTSPFALTVQEQQAVARVEEYLNGLTHLDLSFVQTWPDGNQGAGMLHYEPGHLKLDYTNPKGMVLTAGDGHLVLDNPQTGAVTRMGLSHTPLGLLLAHPIRMQGAVTVTAVRREVAMLQVSVARTDRMSDGLLTLRFRDDGARLALSGLIIVDDRQHVITLDFSD
ncbi:LolA family protein [Acetobacter sp.]|jgi:outer membrane lipoprotein-sorting protein|uniref:LolA family protein n=1 Tax=Acetobacter sp. TaxID=440 RepID=UPI0025C0CED6|nr:outer membrane lipoprotein carrier protein LolA [Acetobacter sp.]MCH4090343.1 outer membrane lipoprotein carrier protein LolA [Acetobacter sp.]MCI1299037.1 outer membrane lipoprotein carrier protein LolA [Acetobacter sp.]MCI1315057.1 outer membrane lipoprotein carrier protein LolA [Acetobacter sp.]